MLASNRDALIQSLDRINKLIDKKGSTFTIFELETRVGMVESTYGQLSAVQNEIEQHGDECDYEARHSFEETYCTVKLKILSAIAAINRKQPPILDQSHAIHNGSVAFVRSKNLPKLSIPTFSGKYTEWTNWSNIFMSLVDNDTEIDDLSKFVHLRASLGTIPLRTIESIELTAQNYVHAFQILKDRFENKAIIFQAHVRELFELPKMRNQSASSLRELIDTVNSHLRALKSLGSVEDLCHVLIFHLICLKLDSETIKRWEDNATMDNLPTWDSFSKYLSNRCTTLENREFSNHTSNEKVDKKATSNVLSAGSDQRSCAFCKGSHALENCHKLDKLNPRQRYREIKKRGLCIVCFSNSHSTRDCAASPCSECLGKHHKFLHRTENSPNPSGSGPTNTSTPVVANLADSKSNIDDKEPSMANNFRKTELNTINLIMSNSINFLATAIVLVKNSSGQFVECRAVLDAGSQLNFITQKCIEILSLRAEKDNMVINGIGNATASTTGKLQAIIRSRVTNYSSCLQFTVMPSITKYGTNLSLDASQWNLPKNIKMADLHFYKSRSIDMLIGVSEFFKLLSVGQIRLGENMPLLQKSLLGWLVAGEYVQANELSSLIVHNEPDEAQADLNKLVEKFWKCEEVETANVMVTPEEQFCEQHFLSHVRRTPAGRFIVRLPFKPNSKGVGNSYAIAMKRFNSLERKFNRDEKLKVEYSKFVQEYHDLDHLEKVSNVPLNQIKYFMPHHAVLRPHSESTKLRVVFDASCKSENGLSLNDNLCVGPKLQPDLFEILIRFRCYRYALTADITKMYRQVLVEQNDCDFQCILWRENKNDQVEVLRLKTVTYGTSCAPYLAMRCLKFLAESYKEKYPLASEVLLKNFYVDDMLAGASSQQEIIQLQQEISLLLSFGRFELHKWRSNLDPISFNKVLEKAPLRIDSNDCAKTLGLLWYSTSDTLGFAHANKFNDKISKRVVLSQLAQLFDPLGLLNPIVVLGKLFMQELWRLKLDWDESLPQELHVKWQKYRNEIALVPKFRCPRLVADVVSARVVELHAFSDASTRAFGGAIYVRTIDKEGSVLINLLSAKSRIAPLKSISLPKLELQGAVLTAKLVHNITNCLPIKVNSIFYWTDSAIVLHWLASHPSRWPTFEANRVATIQSLTKVSNWRKIDSKSNPADIVSRGCWPQDLMNNELWFKGPTFLSSTTLDWPIQQMKISDEEISGIKERKNFVALAAESCTFEDLVQHCKFANDFLKLNRVFGFIFRWVNNTKLKMAGQQLRATTLSPLTVFELRKALNYIIYKVQQVEFLNEIREIENNQIIQSARLQKLSPFLDKTDKIPILRVGGRLSKSNLEYKVQHPAILPSNHAFSIAFVVYLHKINLHIGPHALLAFVRQRYWVMNGKAVTQKVVRKCMICFKFRPKASEQLMGNLPSARVIGTINAFQKVGVDFAGPIMIHFKLRGKRPIKAYLALFICFVTKACHLEVVSDLSSQAFLQALKRFFARRGLSHDIYCDNGTNFRGAARQLRQLMNHVYEKAAMNDIQEKCACQGVNFHFIPPHSPHMGGLWESSIKVAKSMLTRHVNGASLTCEELATVTAEIEAIMNSRPLCAMSSDPNDLQALTPGHFLIGRPLNGIPDDIDEDELKVPPMNRWKRIQHIKQLFWRRWTREYLLSLQERCKWRKQIPNLSIGTLVLVADDNLPSQQWMLGRIEDIHPGADQLVRVVTIKTQNGIIKRNIHKLCPLPTENISSLS